MAQIVIAPNVGPEVIAGSTRLKNGTAQKLVLNMISTCAMIKLGRTYSHYMAGTIPANRKLNKRAIRLLKDITGANQEEARKSLEQAGGEIPVALVSLMCGISVYQARERLKSCHGMIRKAIEKTPQMEPYADCQSNFHYTCHLAGFDAGRLEQAFQLLDRHIGDGYQDIPSAVGCVVRKGFIIGPKAYGLTSREGEVRKAAWDTIYDLASLTKVVATTPSVLLLAQQGYIRLDDKVSFFIPEFSTKGKGDITIRQLLTHTSSLPAHIRFWEMGLKGDEVFKAICDIDLVENVEPGTKVIYSDLGFITLGEIVKRVTGLSIDKYSAREVFEHLGMKDTGFVPDPSLKPRIAATEYRKDLGRIMWGQVHDENCYAIGGIAGHAGLFGTAADLAKYALMWLNLGKLEQDKC